MYASGNTEREKEKMAHYIYGDRDRGEIFMGPHSPFTSAWASLSNWCVQTIK
jgi:hypothetical protein